MEKKKKQSNFSIIISLIIFSFSIIIFLIGQFTPDCLYSFGVLYPILMFVIIVATVYAFLTHKNKSTIDCIIISILFLSVLTITIQDFIYLYRSRTGDYYYSLYYNFPGILNLNKHWLVSVEPLKYELASTIVLFDPTLICSAFCVVISMANNIFRRKQC